MGGENPELATGHCFHGTEAIRPPARLRYGAAQLVSLG
jgi:hypothetical protein